MRYGLILTALMGVTFFVQPLRCAETEDTDALLAVATPEVEEPAEETVKEPATPDVPEEVPAEETVEAPAAPDVPIDTPEESPAQEEDAVEPVEEPVTEDVTTDVAAPAEGEDLYEAPEPAPEPAAEEAAEPAPAEVPAEESQPEKPEGVEELVPEEGLDTVGLEGGNWLFNRVWWKYAEEKYEKIKQQVNKIMDARVAFFTERNKADRDIFDPFYIHVGFDRGELDEVIFGLLEDLERERDADDLSEEEQKLLEDAQEKKGVLEKLKVDVATITELDKAINQAISRLMEEINKVRQYEQQAWVTFKKMARLLDDEENKKLYYEMDRLSRSIDAIDRYVSGNFSNYFNQQLHGAAQEKVDLVKNKVRELKEKDILDLKKEAVRLESIDRIAMERDRVQDDEDEMEEEGEAGWLSSVWNTLTYPFVWVWQTIANGISALYDMTLGPAKDEEMALPEMPSAPAEVLEDVQQELPIESSETAES